MGNEKTWRKGWGKGGDGYEVKVGARDCAILKNLLKALTSLTLRISANYKTHRR